MRHVILLRCGWIKVECGVENGELNSDLWKQKIKASQYWTLVYASKNVTVYGAASETITIEGYYGSFTTGTDGSCSHVVPIGEITLTGSVSGQSFTRTVTSDTTEVYVMPKGSLFWYGYNNDFTSVVDNNLVSDGGSISFNTNDIKIVCGRTGGGALVQLNQNIDVSKYTKLCCVTNYSADENVNSVALTNSKLEKWTLNEFDSKIIVQKRITKIGLEQTVLDISSYGQTSANAYVQFNTKGTGYIFACWFE